MDKNLKAQDKFEEIIFSLHPTIFKTRGKPDVITYCKQMNHRFYLQWISVEQMRKLSCWVPEPLLPEVINSVVKGETNECL